VNFLRKPPGTHCHHSSSSLVLGMAAWLGGQKEGRAGQPAASKAMSFKFK